MSSRVLNSRFNRRETRSSSTAKAAVTPADRDSPKAAPVTPAAAELPGQAVAGDHPAAAAPPVACEPVKFGFVRLFGQLTVIEVSEEVWGSRRYYKAVFSADPSVCIKAPQLDEAVVTLIRHLMRSPTIRRIHFGQPARTEV
jgi:hypothetical protein